MKNPRVAARSGLEARLGYQFAEAALLDHALTHVSAIKGDNPRPGSYQRFEFLGDRVLGLVVAEMLFKAFPDVPEGELSQRLSELVSADTCAQVAAEIGLGEAVKLGEGEARSGGRKKKALLADVCESVIAAVYMDGGLEPARQLIHTNWQDRMLRPRTHLRDGKTALQEWAHGRGLATPDYREIGRIGPDHHPVFQVEVSVSGGDPARGEGRTKRVAEKAAAEAFLIREGIWANEAT